MAPNLSDSRKKVIREAANLLYSGEEKEYKQAKLKAAKTFGLHFMPTNTEVATELDRIAEETEGPARQERLVKMRKEALQLMKNLRKYDPILVGSVWRGTIHQGSDVDIIIHHEEPTKVLKEVERTDLEVEKSEWVNITKKGKKRASFHIHAKSPLREEFEIIVHSPEEACLKEKCEIYGDDVGGLHTDELDEILRNSPFKRFVPF